MKRILVITGLLLASANIFANAQEPYTYTPEYIKHLKNCSVYTEEYQTEIPTGDVNSPYLKVKSTEEIIGYLNSKCYTRSTVYSYDLDKTILKIKCGLTKAQMAESARMMERVNAETSPETRKSLQQYLTNFIENKNICRVKNYLEEEGEGEKQ